MSSPFHLGSYVRIYSTGIIGAVNSSVRKNIGTSSPDRAENVDVLTARHHDA